MGFLYLFRICKTSTNANSIGLMVVAIFLHNMGIVGMEKKKKKMPSEEGRTEVDERMEEETQT